MKTTKLLFCWAFLMASFAGQHDAPYECDGPVATHPDYHANQAKTLYKLYADNQIRADLQCRGKWFVLDGGLQDIGRNEQGTPYVDLVSAQHYRRDSKGIYSVVIEYLPVGVSELKSGTIRWSTSSNLIVRCYFNKDQEDALAKLEKHQRVLIYGKCEGKEVIGIVERGSASTLGKEVLVVRMSKCRIYQTPAYRKRIVKSSQSSSKIIRVSPVSGPPPRPRTMVT